MSASSKKKLRKEQAAVKMTPRQEQERKEAKKLRIQTTAFIVVIALVLVTALGVMAYRGIIGSGLLQKNITAATIGEHKLTAAELNYFYIDAISNQYSSWQSSFGSNTQVYLNNYYNLDITAPLNAQYYKPDEKITWADNFIESAFSDAKATYAIYDKAVASGYTLSGDSLEEYEGWVKTYEQQSELYGSTVDEMIEGNYGPGSNFESWKNYLKVVITAQAFAADYANSLVYEDSELRKQEEGREKEFSSYSFASYHLSHTKYPELGTKGENGNVTYTDAQKAAALEAAKKDAESLTAATSVEEFDKLIANLKCNADSKSAASTKTEDQGYSKINEILREWLSDPARKAGDTTVIANTSTSKDEDGKETTITNGYFTLLFTGVNDNSDYLANVRHLLVQFEGGTTDSEGNKTYTDAEKATAKKEADRLYNIWKENPTQEHFIDLVKEHSDDSSAEDGGLFENISPADSYVTEFLDWSLDTKRKQGDCEIIETQFGYHIMYYVGDDELTYRDSLITQELKDRDYTEWYEDTVDAISAELGNTGLLKKDFMIANLSSNYGF